MSIIAVTKHYAQCPHCDDNTGDTIDHLLQQLEAGKTVKAGPWSCGNCGLPYEVVSENGALTIRKSEAKYASKTIKTWDLLELTTQEGKRVRLLLNQKRWERNGEVICPQEVEDHKEYYYNEHTCPTNWTGSIFAVIEEDDEDPHGVFQFVASVDQDKAIYKDVDARNNLERREVDLQATFPEHFKPLEPAAAKEQLIEKLPSLLIDMLKHGQEVAVRLVKDNAFHGATPVRYVIETKEVDKDGRPDTTRYGITISSKLGAQFMSFHKPKEEGQNK